MDDENENNKFAILNSISDLLREYLNLLSEQREDIERRSLIDEGSVIIESVQLGVHDETTFGVQSYGSLMQFMSRSIMLESKRYSETSQNILANLQLIIMKLGTLVHKDDTNKDDKLEMSSVEDGQGSDVKKYIKKQLVRSFVKLEPTYKCQQCPLLSFEHFKVYQKHKKDVHSEKVSAPDKKDFYICLLPKKTNPSKQCGQKVSKDLDCLLRFLLSFSLLIKSNVKFIVLLY